MKKAVIFFCCICSMAFFVQGQSVGIGTTTPSEKLEIIGNAKADTLKSNSLKIHVNAGTGKVLTSDANGVAGWQTAPGALKALNGLSKSNDTVKLGGLISENTLLRLNANSFLVTDTGTAISLSISQPNFPLANGLSATPVTQTFTATANATLASIDLYVASFAGSSITVQIKDLSNIVLGAVTNNYGAIFNNWSTFNINNVLLTSGQQYTLSLTCTGTTQIQYDNSNPYAGGSSSIGSTADIAFKVFSSAEKNLFFLKGNKIGINNNNPTATVDIAGTIKINDGTQGIGKLLVSDAGGNANWQELTSSGVGGWSTNGNGSITAANFIGTTDNNSFVFKINNGFAGNINTGGSVSLGKGALFNNISSNVNAAIGDSALFNNTSGSFNSAFGLNALYSNTAGFYNTATGTNALYSNSIGINNTANGQGALHSNATGNENTAIGAETLFSNVSGSYNTSTGKGALYNNTEGSFNTANGVKALYANTTGISNIASGTESLFLNTTGSFNSAIGAAALFSNETGSFNTAYGTNTLFSNTTGSANIAIGRASLRNNTAKSNLIAIGDSALYNNGIGASGSVQASENTAVGDKALFSNSTGNSNSANGFQSLFSNTTGAFNNAYGSRALFSNTTGSFNVAIGSDALYANTSGSNNAAYGASALYSNTAGGLNTANGFNALFSNTTGVVNTANGDRALYSNTTGNSNTANGSRALFSNTTGVLNTANGFNALFSNTTGVVNTANGASALYSNTTGFHNTANGYDALYSNTTGNYNTSNGNRALYSNTTGNDNTANGREALFFNTTGNQNTANGVLALQSNTTASDNTATGYRALRNSTGNFNSALGSEALANGTGSFSTAVGYQALLNNSQSGSTAVGQISGTTCTGCIEVSLFGRLADVSAGIAGIANNASAIGARAVVNASNKVRIGNTSVTVIEGQVGWSIPSDGRFKINIKDDVPGLQLINLLRPVSYNFETEKFQRFLGTPDSIIDETKSQIAASSQIKNTGLIAQELEEALKKIGYDFSGLHIPQNDKDNYSIAYDNFIPVVIRALQELDAKNKEQEKTIAELKKQLIELNEKINHLISKK
jgi:hypothetical protein